MATTPGIIVSEETPSLSTCMNSLRCESDAIPEVDNWRLGLFAHDDARSRGHYLSVIIASERGELLRFHERSFLAGIDPRSFHWRQRGVRNWIGVIPRSG